MQSDLTFVASVFDYLSFLFFKADVKFFCASIMDPLVCMKAACFSLLSRFSKVQSFLKWTFSVIERTLNCVETSSTQIIQKLFNNKQENLSCIERRKSTHVFLLLTQYQQRNQRWAWSTNDYSPQYHHTFHFFESQSSQKF